MIRVPVQMLATKLTRKDAMTMVDSLTKRELTAAWCITLGKTSEEICAAMGVRDSTLSIYRMNIRAKFGGVPVYGIPRIMICALGETWPKELE